jgi:hypothetical protein
MDLREIEWDDMDCIFLLLDEDQLQAFLALY